MRAVQLKKMRDCWKDKRRELRGHHHAREHQGERKNRQDTDAPDDTKKSPPTRAGGLIEDERLRAAALGSRHTSSLADAASDWEDEDPDPNSAQKWSADGGVTRTEGSRTFAKRAVGTVKKSIETRSRT
jgi:hypothetical protein